VVARTATPLVALRARDRRTICVLPLNIVHEKSQTSSTFLVSFFWRPKVFIFA
jgi:hypothetical protein